MKNIIELKNISKNFNNKIILKNLNLFIKYNDFYGLIGANGSGKSTLIKIISGIIQNYKGEVKIFNKNKKLYINLINKLGIVPQEFNFNPFETVYNILRYQLGYNGINFKNEKLIDKCLNKLNILDIKNKKIHELSGGNKRKILIAKSIIHKPKIIILDEPFVGLDIKYKYYLYDILKKLNKKHKLTILLITHQLDEINNLCKNIGILKNGNIKNIYNKKLKTEEKYKNFDITIFKKKYDNKIFKKFNVVFLNKNLINVKIKNKKYLNEILIFLIKNKFNIININSFSNIKNLLIKNI